MCTTLDQAEPNNRFRAANPIRYFHTNQTAIAATCDILLHNDIKEHNATVEQLNFLYLQLQKTNATNKQQAYNKIQRKYRQYIQAQCLLHKKGQD